MGLTDKQERFALEYTKDFNATEAAVRAGYSKKSAHSIGWENLRKPEIQERVAAIARRQADEVNLSVESVLTRLVHLSENASPDSAQIRALELLGKHLAMFTDRVSVDGGLDLDITLNGVDIGKLK